MKKVIFLDIDGTLLDMRGGIPDITQTVKQFIRKVQDNGDYVFIATGRPYAFLSDNIKNFGFDGFILANGAHVVLNNETIYNYPIYKEIVNNISSKLEENNIEYILEGEKYSYLKECCTSFYAFYDEVKVSRKYLEPNYNIEEIDVYKIEVMCKNEIEFKTCLEAIKSNPELDYFSSIDNKIVEMYLKKNTKATGILKAIEYLDLPIENTYAFGDGKNDIEMLSVVGCGIAMGNASDEVKKYADEITDSVHNDGVAVGIEKYIIA